MSELTKLRRAKNGCNCEIQFDGKYVYHRWDRSGHNVSELGPKMDKNTWIKEHVVDAKHVDVQKMLVDWELYENGWFIVGYSNNHLFNYRCQLGNPPKGVSYFSCIFPIAC
jgi:hypothetical protein